MKVWKASDARARFCELVRCTLQEGPQMITRRGKAAVVFVSARDWRQLQELQKPLSERDLARKNRRS